MRVRRGEPVLLPRKERPSDSDIRRFYTPAVLMFGDREGEKVIQIEADQEQSTFLLHNALNDLHPKVRTVIIAASNTGDLAEAAAVAGLSEEQVPRLRVYLQQHLQ